MPDHPPHPDLMAVGAVVRLLFREIATLKRPDNPTAEMAHLRQKLTEELAATPVNPRVEDPDAFRATMLDAISLLLPLAADRKSIQ